MAIDWTTSANALFKKLGRIVRIVEIYDAFETDIDGDIDTILNTTWAGEDLDYYTWAKTELLRIKDQMKNQLTAMREEVASSAPLVVQGELTATDGAPQLSNVDLMNRMIQRMLEDNYGVTQAGPQSDGYLADAYGYRIKLFSDQSPWNALYSARVRQFSHVTFTKIYSEPTDVSKRYAEKVALYVEDAGYNRPGGKNWGKVFPRQIVEVTNASSNKNKVKNGSFENAEVDNLTPKDWIISGGAWGTDAYVTNAYSYLLNRSMELVTSGILLKQLVPEGTLKPRTMYVACMRAMDLDAVGAWTVTLSLKTPYQTITVVTASTIDSFDHFYGAFITPDIVTGAEWQLTGTHGGGVDPAIVDEILVMEASTFAGIPYIAVPATDGLPVQGLKISDDIVNDTGKFASFFGRFFNANLPNHSGGTAVNENLVA